MRKHQYLKWSSLIFIPAALFIFGCNQTPGDSQAPESGVAKPESFNPSDKPEFTDISAESAQNSSPLILVGKGAANQIESSTLKALYEAMIQNGQTNSAKQLQASYDFETGQYKGAVAAMKTAASQKAAWWNYGYISHRGAIYGSWLPWQGNGVWSGDDAGPRLTGWNITSAIEDGVTPSLRWNVLWNNGAGWTALRAWNDQGSTGNYYLQAIRGYSSYQYYHVCYDVSYTVTDPGSHHGETGIKTGCDGYAAGGPAATQNGQPYLCELKKIKFTLFYSAIFVASP